MDSGLIEETKEVKVEIAVKDLVEQLAHLREVYAKAEKRLDEAESTYDVGFQTGCVFGLATALNRIDFGIKVLKEALELKE